MSNYETARPLGSTGSRYLLDNSFDYYLRKSGGDYGRNSDYTHGSRQYEAPNYNTTYDYGVGSGREDYGKYRYDTYNAEGKNFMRQKPSKLDIRDLRNTTNVLPSYLEEQRKRDFMVHSPNKETGKDTYDRRPMKTTYEGAAGSSRIGKDWRDSPPKNYDKADYLSPSKYDNKGTSSTSALSPNHYKKEPLPKYDNKSRLNELMARINKLPGSPLPTSPISQNSPTSPRDREDLRKKYEKYLPSSSGTPKPYEYDKKEEYSPLYQSTSNTDKRKKEDEIAAVLADSRSGDLFKKHKDYRDVKSPEKDLNKRIGGYSSTIKKEESSPPSYLSDSASKLADSLKLTSSASNITSSTLREKDYKTTSPSYGLSPTSSRLQGEFKLSDFKIGKSKGEGKFGQVFVAWHKATASLFALKKIPKDTIKQHMMEDQLVLEIKLQAYLNHPNILKLYSFFADDKNIYLVLEYMNEGTLFEHLKRRKDRMTEKEVSRRIAEIANAIKYLHDLDIAHRDIKPENIVLSNVHQLLRQGMGKLCDFGWATRCTNRRKTYCGTFDYVAPEILEGKEYDWCVDLWCLGVLTYELLMGKVPFYNISRKETMKKILSCGSDPLTFSSDISFEARDFVECLIKKAPEERRRADQLMDHPFLSKHLETEYLSMKY